MRQEAMVQGEAVEALVNPLIVEIADALVELGGEADRDRVLGLAASRLGVSAGADPSHALIEAFDRHMAQAERQGAPPLFLLPSGAGLQRLSLTDQARRLLRS